jgi:hypothetical protein
MLRAQEIKTLLSNSTELILLRLPKSVDVKTIVDFIASIGYNNQFAVQAELLTTPVPIVQCKTVDDFFYPHITSMLTHLNTGIPLVEEVVVNKLYCGQSILGELEDVCKLLWPSAIFVLHE